MSSSCTDARPCVSTFYFMNYWRKLFVPSISCTYARPCVSTFYFMNFLLYELFNKYKLGLAQWVILMLSHLL